MSPGNVEIVRAAWDAWGRGGFPDEFGEDIEFHIASYHPEAASGRDPIRGREQVRKMLASYWETVREPWVETEEFIDCGDRIVVRWRGGGIGRVSGLPFEWQNTHVYRVLGGQVVEVREYGDHAEALEAVGLRE